ncbi:MAG: hypothetical protein NC349_10305, partial [Paenibacillus sp.]|nr:hypothetical protein [Paenibacillus sp.]
MENNKKLKYTMTDKTILALLFLFSYINVIAENPGDSIPPEPPIETYSTNVVIDTFKPHDPILPPILPKDPDRPVIPINPGLSFEDPEVPTVDPLKPDIPSIGSNTAAVGTPAGNLLVDRMGAANYTVAIKCPDGGGLAPEISISYNSQKSSYGLAGYGVDLSGFSAITRGEKTLFDNNGSIQGVTYTESDNLYLDSKRLILLSGSPCKDGAEYCLEGDPYTKVVAHGTYNATDNAVGVMYFEVSTSHGRTYQYGSTSDSRVDYKNKLGQAHIASWY